jgi:hypothetical protein
MKTTGVLCWIALAGMLPAAEELEQQREQLLKSVEQAWEASLAKPVEPVIAQIKVESGTAFELLQQMEEALGKKESSPIVVAVPVKTLSRLQIDSVEMKDIPLGEAMEILSKITKLRTSNRNGVWWVEQPEELDGDFDTRVYNLSPAVMKAIGLEFAGEAKPGSVSRGGKGWPVEASAMATYVPTGEKLVVRATRKEIAELDAIVLLQRAGYDVTLRK